MPTTSKPGAVKPKAHKPRAGKKPAEVLEEARAERTTERRLRAGKYDWEAMRDRFISDPNISLKELAQEYDCAYTYVRQRSSEERWAYLRVEEQRRLFKKKREETARSLLEKATKFDEGSQTVATMGQALIMARLSEIAELHQATQGTMKATISKVRQGVPIAKEDLYSAVRYTELRELAMAAKLFQDMGRMAFGVADAAATLEQDASGDTGVENVISVAAELGKDDPQRLTALLEAYERAGMVQVLLNVMGDDEESTIDPDMVEGEVVGTSDIASTNDAMKELTAT